MIETLPEEINTIFKANNIGYEFILNKEEKGCSFRIVKKSDDFIHSKIVQPAWQWLQSKGIFKGAYEEFCKSLDFLSSPAPDYPNSIKEANSAFESTMKIITANDKHLQNMENETAVNLITELVRGGYVDSKLQQGFQSLPTFANMKGRHGKGPTKESPTKEEAEFALGLASMFITFLIKEFYKRQKGTD